MRDCSSYPALSVAGGTRIEHHCDEPQRWVRIRRLCLMIDLQLFLQIPLAHVKESCPVSPSENLEASTNFGCR